jgi:hypothetical protein
MQRAARARLRLLAARRSVTVTRRSEQSSFKACGSAGAVLHVVEDRAELPANASTPWLWAEVADPWWGVAPQALCRRAGRPELATVLRDRKITTVRGLARAQLRKADKKRSRSKAQEQEDAALEDCVALAKAVLDRYTQRDPRGSSGSVDSRDAATSPRTPDESSAASSERARASALLEDARPLDAGERTAAIFEVCALRFGNLSRRKKESGDASGVALAKLPGPCRGLIHALEDPALYEGGMAPRDMSKAALRRFLSKHADADRATRALESGALARAPRLPGQDKSDSTSLQRECSARGARQKHRPRFEATPRDDRSSKNKPKRAENGPDRSL